VNVAPRGRDTAGRRLQVGLLAVMLGATGCTAREASMAGGERIKLRVVLQPYLAHAPFFIANAESLWTRYGLDVELVPLSRASDAVPLLLSGDIDVLPTGPSPALLNAAGRGIMVRAVADRGYLDPATCSYYAMAARPGLLKNGRLTAPVRRVSIDKQPHSMFIVRRMLEHVGISLDTLEMLDIPPAAELDALAKGTIDAAFVGEPWLTRVIGGGHGELWVKAADALPGFEIGMVYFGPSILSHNREGGRRFMLAYREAVMRYLEGKTDRNIDILVRETGETPELLRQSCWLPMAADGRIKPSSFAMLQKWAVGAGLVETAATPAQFWDSSFVAYADSVFARRPN
jgi:NitT/TauT family transport system substrate-binding protein